MIAEILERVLNNLSEDNWMKGRICNDEQTKFCAVGHMALASGVLINGTTNYVNEIDRDSYYAARNYLDDRLVDDGFFNGVPRFNDNAHTTYEDVRLFFKTAHEDALREGI